MVRIYQKPALDFVQQLQLLLDRGLEVGDTDTVISQLSSISYFRLSAYWYTFRARDPKGVVTDKFVSGTSFDDVIALYEFDRSLRLLLFDAIERVEIHIRSSISYELSHAYGVFAHTDASNFHSKFKHQLWLDKINSEASRSKDACIKHYKKVYEGFPKLPIWVVTEIMSLGSLSLCYKGLINSDKRKIADKFDVHNKRLADWLHIMTYIRNVCAHHSRLWNRELAIRPEKSKLKEWNAPITPKNDRIFYVLLMLRYLLKSNHEGDAWCKRCNNLIEPFVQDDNCRRVAMGLPENWVNHPVWK